jgi:hypothetical protein
MLFRGIDDSDELLSRLVRFTRAARVTTVGRTTAPREVAGQRNSDPHHASE